MHSRRPETTPRSTTRLQTWLARGLAAGAFIALFEALFTAGSGTNVPLTYLLLIVTVDLGFGLLLGAFLAALHRLPGLRRQGFAAELVLTALGVTLLFQLQKAMGAASYRGVSATLAVALMVGAVAVSVPALSWLLRRTCRTRRPQISLALSLLLVCLWLVGGRHLTKVLFASYFTVPAVVANLILLSILFLAILAQDRLVGRWGPMTARWRLSWPAFSLLAAVAACGAALGAWATAPEPALPTVGPSGGAGQRPAHAAGANPTPNVILITLDTLRADRLSLYGYPRPTSPELEVMAEEAVVYLDAISPAAWTLPAHASLFTGTLPLRHGAHNQEPPAPAEPTFVPARPLHRKNETLAEILSQRGYRTAGVSANHLFVSRRLGMDQGFELFDDRPGVVLDYVPAVDPLLQNLDLFQLRRLLKPYRTADEISRAAFSWLDAHGHDGPFFLFLNYMDPHRPYCPPAPYDRRFPGIRQRMRWPEDAIHRRERKLTEREREHYAAAYDGEIAYLDHQLGRLFDRLRSAGLYDSSLIVVTSDHGEFFGEHDLLEHGFGPYEPVHRVPLIIKYPHAARTGTVGRRVSTLQTLPTVLAALGVPGSPGLDAVALEVSGQEIIAEQYLPMFLVVGYGERFNRGYRTFYDGPWKLVRFSDGETMLFNLANDPGEDHDLAGQHPEVVSDLLEQLQRHMSSVTPIRGGNDPPRPMDEKQRRKLKALGYIG